MSQWERGKREPIESPGNGSFGGSHGPLRGGGVQKAANLSQGKRFKQTFDILR